jgi:hypothetical protein
MKSSKGYTDTKGIKEWNNAFDRIPLTKLWGRKGEKNDTLNKNKKKRERETGKLHDRHRQLGQHFMKTGNFEDIYVTVFCSKWGAAKMCEEKGLHKTVKTAKSMGHCVANLCIFISTLEK